MRFVIFVSVLSFVSACAQKADLASQYAPQSVSSAQSSASEMNPEYARSRTTSPVAVDLRLCAASGPIESASSLSLAHYVLSGTKPGQRITVGPDIISIYAKSMNDEATREGTEPGEVLTRHKNADAACFARQVGQGSDGPARTASMGRWKANTQMASQSSSGRFSTSHVIRSFEKLYNQLEAIMTNGDPEELGENIAREFLPVTIDLPNAEPPLGKRR